MTLLQTRVEDGAGWPMATGFANVMAFRWIPRSDGSSRPTGSFGGEDGRGFLLHSHAGRKLDGIEVRDEPGERSEGHGGKQEWKCEFHKPGIACGV